MVSRGPTAYIYEFWALLPLGHPSAGLGEDRAGLDQLLRALLQVHVVSLLRRINDHLVRWAMPKYKRLRRREKRAGELLAKASRRSPQLFAHWRIGLKPDGWTMGAG
jgi:hypothetical protein